MHFCPHCQHAFSDATLAECPNCNQAQPRFGWRLDRRLGTRIDHGKYELRRRLGAGGFAVVYEAYDFIQDDIKAVKVLSERTGAKAEIRNRFLKEANALKSLVHPNIVACHDFGFVESGEPYMVLDLVVGHALRKEVKPTEKRTQTLSVERTLEIAIQVCAGLLAAHRKGLLHRDLNPNNVMMDTSGTYDNPRIIDFGLAKILGSNTIDRMTHSVLGTPAYMAPEQFTPGVALDARLDLWQLGGLIHFMLTGSPPHPEKENLAAILAHIAVETNSEDRQLGPRPSALNPALKEFTEVDDLVASLLATNRDVRPSSTGGVLERLQDLLAGISRRHQIGATAIMKSPFASATTSPDPPRMRFCGACNSTIISHDAESCAKCGTARPSAGWPADKLLHFELPGRRFIHARDGDSGVTVRYHVRRPGSPDETLFAASRFAHLKPAHTFVTEDLPAYVGLEHPRLQTITEVGIVQPMGIPYWLASRVLHPTLADVIWPSNRALPALWPVQDVCLLGADLCDGLAALHARTLWHGQLRPNTVLVDDERRPVIAALGEAPLMLSIESGHTLDAAPNPLYMSPEQFDSDVRADQLADVYQMGAVIYFALTGCPPYVLFEDNPNRVGSIFKVYKAQKVREQSHGPQPAERLPALSAFKELNELVGRCLSTKREARPQSVRDLGTEFQRLAVKYSQWLS